MTTLKRLCDDDVRAVFDCLHNYAPPPDHLSFKIVPVGPRGLKLSPPSHEFDDGLYVLLRPLRKKTKKGAGAGGNHHDRRDGDGNGEGGSSSARGGADNNSGAVVVVGDRPQDRVPEHLAHLIMAEHELPPETCPWSLSGPQFPTPTNIQQRYCYPRGNLEYSSRKGGALWTMCDETGKEDTEYRLLHVYLSPKRAANKGVDLSQEEKDLVYQRQRQQQQQQQQAAAASVAGTSGAGTASASPKSKKARYNRKSAVIHRRTQGLQPPSTPGKTSRFRIYGPNQRTHIMVSTSTSTASPPHYGTAMLVSSPPSLSPLSFDRLPTASSTSPSTSLYSDPYGGSGHHHRLHPQSFNYPHHHHHSSGPVAHPGHSFDNLFPHSFASERPAPFVTPPHGSSRRSRHDPYRHRRTSSDEGDHQYRHFLATSNGDRHVHEEHFHGAGGIHRPEDDVHPHNLRQSPLRRGESFLDDPRADPFWDGHGPKYAGDNDDDDDDNPIRLANTDRDDVGKGPSRAAPFPSESDLHRWQQKHHHETISATDLKPAGMLSKSEGSDACSMSTDPFGIHQPDNALFQTPSDRSGCQAMGGARRSSLRFHRRSSSNTSSYSTTSAVIGVTLDQVESRDPAVSPSYSLARRLTGVQRSLRDVVLSHPPALRGKLTSMVVHWAARLKLDPLADVNEDNDEVLDTPMAGVDDQSTHQIDAVDVGPAAGERPSTFQSARSLNSNNQNSSGSDSGMETSQEVSDLPMSVTAV